MPSGHGTRTDRESQQVGRRSNDQPLRLTRIRVIPCADVSAVYNTVLKRVLNAKRALPVRSEARADEHDRAGATDG